MQLTSLPRPAAIAAVAVALAAGLYASGCSTSEGTTPGAAGPTCEVPVERFKELSIVDEAVMSDPQTSNATGGLLSFRHLVEQMKPEGMSSSAFVTDWLSSWNREQRVNLFVVPRRPKVDAILTCPWLKRTTENGCNADCSTCAARELDLAKAPFRLIGIVNRMDLRETEQRDGVGEGRLVFALVDGNADDPAAQPLRMTLGLEYDLPFSEGRDARYWANRWHALGRHADFGDAFRAELVSVVDEFTKRGANPSGPNGSALGQARTNEIDLDWQWDLREFHLTDGGLRIAPTLNTPDKSVNGSAELGRFVAANKEDILRDRHQTPLVITGGIAVPDTRWRIPGVGEDVRRAFAKNTCDGCHQTEETSLDFNFHLSPFRKGIAKLSPFLNNPDGAPDTLTAREVSLRSALCAP